MAIAINMPRLSDTMEEGVVSKWHVKVGDVIKEGDILADIETDKATMEFESFEDGTLLHIGVQEGNTIPVDQLIAVIGSEGEDISAIINGKPNEVSQQEPQSTSDNQVSSNQQDSAVIPQGVEVITMPRLSDTMEEGTVSSWIKKVGDDVNEGDILAEIETDKATMEFESFYKGTLLHIGVQEGQTTKVDNLLAIIGPQGTDVSAIVSKGGVGGVITTTEVTSSSSSADIAKESLDVKKPEPSVQTSSTKNVVDNSTQRIFASPLAKKLAQDKGISLAQVSGTGENGRITKRDIESFVPVVASNNLETVATTTTVAGLVEQTNEIPNSQMRKAIAKGLSKSKFNAPHYYLTIEVDMDSAIKSRKAINASLVDAKVSFNDMVLKACAIALTKHPQVNTSWQDDKTLQYEHIHIGVAVAVPDGLVVPVITFADQKRLTQIGTEVKTLAKKAKDKKLTPNEMSGSTFTVSNLGMFGIQEFTSIINQPNSAILSVGAIVEKPVVKNGAIVVGNTMKVTLACDHRTIDGAAAAQFLQTLKQHIEQPVTMLA